MSFRSSTSPVEIPQVTYYMKVALWEFRRRRLTRKLTGGGATEWEIVAALREHVKTHPHPTG